MTRLPGFLANNNYVFMLDALCQRYGQRPSTVIGIDNEITALDFDLAVLYKASSIANKEISTLDSETETRRLHGQFSKIKAMQNKAARHGKK